jgi:hypothetical protein
MLWLFAFLLGGVLLMVGRRLRGVKPAVTEGKR